jgi:hypothetical protein
MLGSLPGHTKSAEVVVASRRGRLYVSELRLASNENDPCEPDIIARRSRHHATHFQRAVGAVAHAAVRRTAR